MGSLHNKQEMGIGTEQTSINDFYLHQVIGEGGFGRVMSSIVSNATICATIPSNNI